MGNAISAPRPDMLVALSRLVTTGRLLSGVVHEVNNALLVISGTVELLEGQPALPEAVTRGLDRLRRQSARAATALGDVTSFTQASLQEQTEIDLRELTRAAVELRRFAATRAGVSLQFEAAAEPCPVRANAGYLQQAIINLIINGETVMKGSKGAVTITLLVDGDWAVVRVSDRCVRTEAEAASAFEPFDPEKPATDISGLALFAARVIAETHGGTLALDRDIAGTSFVMRLPRGH